MNAAHACQQILGAIDDNVLLERLFFASFELALLAPVVALVAALCHKRSPRLVALLWLLVLLKPTASLAIGSPLAIELPSIVVDNAAATDFVAASNAADPFGNVAPPTLIDASTAVDRVPVLRDSAETGQRRTAPAAASALGHGALQKTSSTKPGDGSRFAFAAQLIVAGWTLGVLGFGGAALLEQFRLRRLIARSALAGEPLTRRLAALARKAGAKKTPQLRITDELESPALAGVLAPVILLPDWLAKYHAHEPTLLDWSLRHELAHFKHGDALGNLVRSAAKILFFFHPAAWWAANRWRIAMELACDRAVVDSQVEARDYAEGLYRLLTGMQNRRRLALGGSLFATRTQIGRRIETLLAENFRGRRRLSTATTLALAAAAIVCLSVGPKFADPRLQQASAAPQQDAAGAGGNPNASATSSNAPARRNDPLASYADSPDASDARQIEPPAAEQTVLLPGVAVKYQGVSEIYASAIARTVSAARSIAIERFGCDMPPTIRLDVRADPSASVRLFNDGQGHFFLTVRDESDLQKPSASGVFHIYGLCHETAHLAMYRPIRERGWMTTAAAEGFADYLGARLVDEVYAREGADLWPDSYNYANDGTPRLQQKLSAAQLSDTHRGAQLWKSFFDQFGDRAAAGLFAAWGTARVDLYEPRGALRQSLVQTIDQPQAAAWWERAEAPFVLAIERSRFIAVHAPAENAADSGEISYDNGESAGKNSFAGGGHAVRFTADGDSPTVAAVRIYGSRYGAPQAPDEDFRVWLCDSEFKPIADFGFPYAKFERGSPQWVTLQITPTRVPREFFVCCSFNPTATKGVFVSHDGRSSETSFSGLPGREPRPFSEGNWLIRAVLEDASAARVWTDASGAFSVTAELIGVDGNEVRLKRGDGSVISVPLDRLSAADQTYVRERDAAPGEAPANISAADLAREPLELHSDDGQPAGKKSFPQGFASEFEVPGQGNYLTAVRVHGARYGASRPPREDFQVALCDENFKLIEAFDFPYSKFDRGDSQWVDLRVKPTKVPSKFVICLNFNATGSKGVYVSHDAEGRGLAGSPGRPAGAFTGGDWLIRAVVDRAKAD